MCLSHPLIPALICEKNNENHDKNMDYYLVRDLFCFFSYVSFNLLWSKLVTSKGGSYALKHFPMDISLSLSCTLKK